ncbi:dihydroorotate dehydrogenase electron transfer subunit [Zongyangia hominis]|uniref:Dihydroorotate dehydrogenase B (NAD(+)), electron transfer subunit n=1 Tax=Zongyangia hominis TaxID=2763677 RepID=A0A926EG00_9FIRM|nr:dihydroorotate dehydrogenase electron transfer subunit [Zongyangia hominis]MBC8571002.1 dihydroorotate dehydrogenase electron transfer subunit [Zongyangia hominis]
MQYQQGSFPIVGRQEIADGIYDFKIQCPEMAEQAKAGQFVHIRCPGVTLRRPISICQIDRAAGTLRLVFEVKGEGTRNLAQLRVGDEMDVMGPLGNGFDLRKTAGKAVFVGGGIGVPPMVEAAAAYGAKAAAVLGFRDKSRVILEEDMKALGCDVTVCTDDGSYGRKGLVTDAVKELLMEGDVNAIYACGPMVMLEALATLAKEYGVRCQVSLEERMGCGVGACLVCACKTKTKDGEENYSHVCKNGPVFDAQEVVFHG